MQNIIRAHGLVELGISHIPEGGRVFADMSVHENLDMGAYPTIEKITFPDNHPPVILTSAWGGYLNIKSVDNTKISGILSKPFSFENLIDFFN